MAYSNDAAPGRVPSLLVLLLLTLKSVDGGKSEGE